MDPFARNVPNYGRTGQSSSSSRADPSHPRPLQTVRKSTMGRATNRLREQDAPQRALPTNSSGSESRRREFYPEMIPGSVPRPGPARPTARRPAHPGPGPQKTSSFSFIAPLLSSKIMRPRTKSTPLEPIWADSGQGQVIQGRRKRDEDDIGSRSASRMMTSAAPVLKRGEPTAHRSPLKKQPNEQDGVARPRGFVLGPGFVLRGPESRDVDDDDDDKGDRTSRRIRQSQSVISESARKNDAPVSQGGQERGYDTQKGKKRADGKAARKLHIPDIVEIPDSSSSESEVDDDVTQLMAALDELTLSTAHLKEYHRLPFLQRNLRRGFENRCRLVGIRTEPKQPPTAAVSVLYRYRIDDDDDSDAADEDNSSEYEERMGTMLDWECPLCQLHSSFRTQEMLAFHLRCDHDEVKVSWKEVDSVQEHTWKLDLLIPDPDDLESESEAEAESEDEQAEDQEDEEMKPRLDSAPASPSRAGQNLPHLPSPVPRVARTIEDHEAVAVEPESPVLIPKKLRESSPTPASAERSRSTTQTHRQTVPARSSVPSRYPTPPLSSDPLGPSAQFPYLPETSDDGEVYYSCRPGGPRIYDLLNTLSLEPFGVLSWAIVDREEEIFELEDVRDEDKVMLALWNRWIMLNRVSFIFDGYAKGVIAFVDQYWQMIHRAAGWGALRAFLLIPGHLRGSQDSETLRNIHRYGRMV